MLTTILLLISTFAISFIIGFIAIPRVAHLAHELHLYDMPDSRKVHSLPIPRLGGVVFLPTIIIATAMVVALATRFGLNFNTLIYHGAPQHFVAYLAGAMLLYCLGIYDDMVGVGYRVKFCVQTAAACLLCVSGLWVASLEHIFFVDSIPFWIGMPLTVFFVVYVTNAMNLIDGIDGLASGLASLSLLCMAVLCVISRDMVWAMLAMAFVGVLTVFFGYNVFGHSNKVFMGDSGSLTLGFTLSFMVLHFWQKNPVWNPHLHNIGIVVLSTLVIPMLDVVRVFMSRVRDGRNPFLPDKNHIHHKLMRTGLSVHVTMVTLLLLSATFILLNYLVATYLSQTLILVLDAVLFCVMHCVINVFIYRHERRTGVKWNREL